MTKQETRQLIIEVEKIVVQTFQLSFEEYQEAKTTSKHEFAECRYVVSMMCKKYIAGCSLTAIGEVLKKNHSTILLGIKKGLELAEIDPIYRQKIEQSSINVMASGILTARKPAYFLGWCSGGKYDKEHIQQAVEKIISFGYYLTDVNSITTFKTELKEIGGVIFLAGVD